MAIIKEDEMALLKGVSIKLDDNTMLLYTMQYHTEKGDRSKSKYRWLGRIFKISDLEALISSYKQNQNKLNPWIWPNDPSWTGKILGKDNNCSAAADFYRMKLKKLVDWETGLKLLDGLDRPASKKKGEDVYNTSKAYDTEDLIAEDGTHISLKDKAALLARVNQNVWKDVVKVSTKRTSVPVTPIQAPAPAVAAE